MLVGSLADWLISWIVGGLLGCLLPFKINICTTLNRIIFFN
jgi:hypothetical protein